MDRVGRLVSTSLTFLGLALASPSSAQIGQENELDFAFTKESDGQGEFVYGFSSAGLNKVGATTCEITTKSHTFTCVPIAGGFLPEESFHDLTFSAFNGLLFEIELHWIVTWDKGLPAETVATIDFLTGRGDIADEAWLDVFPSITNPSDGMSGVSPDTTVDWNYGAVDPGDVDINGVFVVLRRGDLEQRSFDLEDCPIPGVCGITTIFLGAPLAPGEWKVTVSNGFDIRDVPDGISTTGDPWILDNGDWLALDSIDRHEFTVINSVPAVSHGGRLALVVVLLSVGLVGLAARPRRGNASRSARRPRLRNAS